MEGRCSLLAWFLVIITVTAAQSTLPGNAKSSPELSRALLLLQRLLLSLTFEDISLQQGAFLASLASSGQTTVRPAGAWSLFDDDEVEDEEYIDPENFEPVELPKAPPCVEAECPSFNCSSQDVEVVKAVSAFPPMLASQMRTACGKTYIMSPTAMTYDEAGLACCKENMSLVSVESGEEYSCLVSLFPEEVTKNSSIWSSGMYLQCPYSYRWCGSMQTFKGLSAWKKGELDNPGECMTAQFGTNPPLSFVESQCNVKQKFICETLTPDEEILRNMEMKKLEKVNCKRPNCPLFDVPTPTAIPASVTLDVACGTRYALITNQKRNYVRAEMECYGLGMRLVSVETREEQLCLEKLYSARIPNNAQVWTSGTDLGCEGRYAWCGSGASIKAVDSLVWMDGEPNNFLASEDCLVMWNYNGHFKLNDEVCVQEYVYICEEISNATISDNGPDMVTIRTTRPPVVETTPFII